MKEKIFKNFSLKVLSAVFAIVLWTVIVNIYDPNTSYTFSNITVQLTNTQSLTDKDYTFEVVDGGKISVTVSGPKSVVTDLKTSDIVATADLSKVTAFTDYVDIQVQVVKDGQVLTDVEAIPRTSALKLSIENRDTKTFAVNVDTTGSASSGYAVSQTSSSPTYIKVTGPTSLVETVASVGASVDISGAQGNITTQADIKMYDSEGNEITSEELEMSSNTADVTVEMNRTKTVSIVAKTSGTLADGYVLTDTHLSQASAVITGKSELLDKTDTITIDSSDISVAGLTSDKTFTFKLSDYLPSGLKLITEDKLYVTVKVQQMATKTIDIPSSSITINNTPSGLKAVLSSNSISVVIAAKDSQLTALSQSDINCSVDLSGLQAGTHSVSVKVSAPSGCSVIGTYNINVTLSDTTQETTTTAPTNSSTTAAATETTTAN